MNKEEALAKLCQYSTCNYKEQIWAPEAKELLEYWSGVEKQIKQLQQENNYLKAQRQELRSWLEEEIIDSKAGSSQYYWFGRVLSKLNELEGNNE